MNVWLDDTSRQECLSWPFDQIEIRGDGVLRLVLDQWTWPDSLKPDRIFNWQLSTKRSGVIDSKWYRGEMGSQCDYHDFSFSKITALGNEHLLSRWLLCWNILWLSLSQELQPTKRSWAKFSFENATWMCQSTQGTPPPRKK